MIEQKETHEIKSMEDEVVFSEKAAIVLVLIALICGMAVGNLIGCDCDLKMDILKVLMSQMTYPLFTFHI